MTTTRGNPTDVVDAPLAASLASGDELLMYRSGQPYRIKADKMTPVHMMLDVGDQTTDLTAATNKKIFRMPYAMVVTAVRASVSTAPVGANIVVDINDSGTTILSTKLSIDDGEKTSTTAATAAVISDSALADDAEISIDIDQIGSGTAGKGLKVILIGYRS